MIRVGFAALFLALVAITGPAGAFDLQQGGKQAPTPNATAPASGVSEKDIGAGLAEDSKSGGAEVRIPGLGKLGVLPKLDFGLELLYGAAEQKRAEEPSDDRNDEVGVRATVKHRF
jgi:hypothetical protein